MIISKRKIWTTSFYKSLVWLILPICILGNIKSCSTYIEAGEHLTPYSVSVRGYYRRDGTYINPYKRRPPGGAAHDVPYENTRTYMALLFFVCLIGDTISIVFFVNMGTSKIKRLQEINKEIQKKKIEEERKLLLEKILEKIDFKISPHPTIPQNLKKGISSKCKFCKKHISTEDFCISFFAVSSLHCVCMDCARIRESLGRNQPRTKYIDEIQYFENYQKALTEFISKFHAENETVAFKFKDYEIRKIFDIRFKNHEHSKIEEPKKPAETSFKLPATNNTVRAAITRIKVKSSNVFAIGYDSNAKILQVEFKNGSVYEYYEVPENIYVAFMNSESKGRFVGNLYRYKYQQI